MARRSVVCGSDSDAEKLTAIICAGCLEDKPCVYRMWSRDWCKDCGAGLRSWTDIMRSQDGDEMVTHYKARFYDKTSPIAMCSVISPFV